MGVRVDKLIGPSQYDLLQDIMSITDDVMKRLPQLLQSVYDQDLEACQKQALFISEQEKAIDDLKHTIRERVHGSLFFSFPKRDYMELIYRFDSISDGCEDAAKTCTYRVIQSPDALRTGLKLLVSDLLDLHEALRRIIADEVPGLVEASFSGPEARAVVAMVDELIKRRFKVREQVHQVLKALFEEDLSVAETLIWQKFILKLEKIAIGIEKTALALRMLLEKK